MGSDVWAGELKKAGWNGLSPGEFLGTAFDVVGTAKVARNNWFVLVQSIPLLDAAELDSWTDRYAHVWRRAQAGTFTRGKYFILVLLVDRTGAEAAERLSEEPLAALLKVPEEIARGGGHAILVLQDRMQVLMPRDMVMWDPLHASQLAGGTHEAVVDAMKAKFPGEAAGLRVTNSELRVTSWQ